MRLFSNRSQKTSKCGKNISDKLATYLFLPHFDVICDLLLNRRTATWNLFVNYVTNSAKLPLWLVKQSLWIELFWRTNYVIEWSDRCTWWWTVQNWRFDWWNSVCACDYSIDARMTGTRDRNLRSSQVNKLLHFCKFLLESKTVRCKVRQRRPLQVTSTR